MDTTPTHRQRVWDLPTRLFHWAIVLLVPFSWWSAKTDHLPWHRLSGYAVLGLLIFRLIWGFVGSQTARFADFIRRPRALIAYLQGRGSSSPGHSPLGGLSVIAMIGALVLQVGLGLFAVDEDGLEPGPLAKFVNFDTGRIIAKIHHLTFYLVLGLAVLHLAAIAYYEIRKKRLLLAMISGKKDLPEEGLALRFARPSTGLAVVVIAAAIAWFVAHGFRLWGPV